MELDELASALKCRLLISTLAEPTRRNDDARDVRSTMDSIPFDTTPVSNETISTQINEQHASTSCNQPSTTYDRWNLLDGSSIDYGSFGAKNLQEKLSHDGGFYITTAINYTNGPAHMGHAYEATTTDAIARYFRVKNGEQKTFFLTGSDEHGQKIANAAEVEGKLPIEICDKYVRGFQCLNQRMRISNNDYLRTTSDRHIQTCQELWKRCAANNSSGLGSDIYLSTYSGWYNIREEAFVTDSEAQLTDFKDPVSGLPLKQVEEESYFFRMSAYHDKLVEHIVENPCFIRPEQHRNNILSRLNSDRLRDLSVSRTTFSWGIPVPDGFDSRHVMYVWFDALTNYLTGVDGLGLTGNEERTSLTNFWPADVHIIGKDILWFHTVIWPCILMSAGLPLPKSVFAHGFVNDKEGKKMSKSMGNVIDPHDMLDNYAVDSFRWYLCAGAPYGGEFSFSVESQETMHNADLCDTLGNLIHRATNLCHKFCNGIVPDVPAPLHAPIDFDAVRLSFVNSMDNYDIEGGAQVAIKAFRDVNGYLTEQAPWHMKGEERSEERMIVVRATLEAVFALAHLLVPFIPLGARQIFLKLNTEPLLLSDLKSDLRNLTIGRPVTIGDVLYSKFSSLDQNQGPAALSKKSESFAEAQQRKKEKRALEIAASKAAQQNDSEDNNQQPEFTKIDIRVGKVTKVWHHPEADKLFCEEIDVGEECPREIASGLRGYYDLAEMQERMVLVVCNLKAAKMVGFTSNGMVLAAKSDDGKTVQLVSPPAGASCGERVFIDGLQGEPYSSAQVKKKKTWEAVVKDLRTGDGGVAMWDGKVIRTKAGPCHVQSLVGAQIS